MAAKQPTIHDVANRAGVSIATVSRVLSGGSASAAARQKVEEAIQALSYRSSVPEKATPARTLALVVSDITNPYYASLCAGAEAEAQRNRYALQVYCNELEQPCNPTLLNQLMEHRPDGAIMIGSVVEHGSQEELLKILVRLRKAMPLVIIGPSVPELDCISITSDLTVSIRKSIAHLMALGHKRIAFIGGNSNVRSASIRENAFYTEMDRLGLPVTRPYNETGFTPHTGRIGVSKLFSVLPASKRPTALIAINDLVALGALRQLQYLGLRVPEDVALIGCDNQFYTPFLNPPLTTVDLHPADHGRSAVSELISAINGGSTFSFSQVRECSLIVRESCGAALGVRSFD